MAPSSQPPPAGSATDVAALERAIAHLAPLHGPLEPPRPGDWLAHHDEPGQSFAEYRAGEPTLADAERHTIYVQPLGDLKPTEHRIIRLTAQYMQRFFHLETRIREPWPLSRIPATARREHPSWGDKQILTRYVLDDMLKPRLPADGAAFLALTNTDLWPGKGYNFVFGQASLRERVGVWSIYRNGDPDESTASFTRVLIRTLKTAVHETGHMFSLQHCTAHPCVMCGSNHREESDRRPLWLCPQCMAKICWGMGVSPMERYRALAAFAVAQGLAAEHAFFRRSLAALGAPE